jgi:ABC-type amino acid transport substrate-binding protein
MSVRLGFFLLLGALALTSAFAERLIVYGDEAYAPLISVHEGAPSGLLVDILRAAALRTGDEYELRLVPWKRAYESALSGLGAIVGISWTKERAQLFDYSEALYSDDIQVVMLRGKEFPFVGVESLRGRTLGGELGASYGQAVDQALAEDVFRVDRDTSVVSRLRKLLAGRLDAALVGNGIGGLNAVLASDRELESQRAKLVVSPRPLVDDLLYLAFPKVASHPQALARLNAALAELRKLPRWPNVGGL